MSQSQFQPDETHQSGPASQPITYSSELKETPVFRQDRTADILSFRAGTFSRSWDRTFHPNETEQAPRSGFGRRLAIADVAAIVFSLGVVIGLLLLLGSELNMFRLGATLVLMLPAWFVIAYVSGLYSLAELRISHGLVDEIGKVAVAVTAWSWLLLVMRAVADAGPTQMTGPILLWAMSVPMILTARALSRGLARCHSRLRIPVAVIGSAVERDAVCERIERHPEWALDVKVTLDLDEPLDPELGEPSTVLKREGVGRVIIAGGPGCLSARTSLVNDLVEHGLTVDVISGGPESIYSNALLHDLEGLPVLSVMPTRFRQVDLRAKRTFDVIAAAIGLLLASPVLVFAVIRIKLDSKGPVLFRQSRCGQDGREIKVLKLRTMLDGADDLREKLRDRESGNGEGDILFKLEDDPRVTPVGRTLRRWSIDEIPQLWNVLRGDMSVVGPRPLPFDEAIQAKGVFWARTRVKPGLAGPWQAYGRSTIPFEDMVRLDYSYVVGWSMAEDMRLLVRTAVAVFNRRGAY